MQENLLSLRHVAKSYQSHKAVQDVSFDVPKGSIFGILGPNGAGKTSTIRIITSITRADAGIILFDGQPLQPVHTEQIGYMPEERGLYKKMKVEEQLLYLAQLRGMSYATAKTELARWFAKFDIDSWRNKPIEELSKGMQQKVQFISTVLHQPKLLILDEPFSGLDPVNATLIQDEIHALCAAGTTILFSTHRMEQIEQICQHIVLINQGRDVLKGEVKTIKAQFKQQHYELIYAATDPLDAAFLAQLPIKEVLSHADNCLKVALGENQNSNMLLNAFIQQQVAILSFREILPTFNEIFIRAVKGGEHHE
jgi:ABC-2 type transport system ATP-binding protein